MVVNERCKYCRHGSGASAPGRTLSLVARRLQLILGEMLVEAGEATIEFGKIVRDLGWFVLPPHEEHMGFASNADIEAAMRA